MITSLTKLTMTRYIDVVCGDLDVLKSDGRIATKEELEETRKKLIFEFTRLSDTASANALINDRNARTKVLSELTLFRTMTNLIGMRAYDEVRHLLKLYGISRPLDDKQIAAEVTRLLKRAETNSKRYDSEDEGKDSVEPKPEEIRAEYDRQAASLMSYFKFQINMDIMTASQFACLIDQARREIKAKLAAAKR